jgi:ribosomal protein S18 acetylase RimI-like enzyme
MAWTIRTGQFSDRESVLQLWEKGEAEPTHTDNIQSIGALIEHDPLALIVAEDRRSIIGSVIAAWDGWRGSVYRLVVAPSHRRLGLGGQLLHEAEARLFAVGAVRIQAIVVDTDPIATSFWRSSGWEQQVQRVRFVKG